MTLQPSANCHLRSWQMQFDHTVITELYLRSQQRGLLIVSLNISSSVALSCKSRHSFSSQVPLLCRSTDTRASSALGEETRAGRYSPRAAAGESSKWLIRNLRSVIKQYMLMWVFFLVLWFVFVLVLFRFWFLCVCVCVFLFCFFNWLMHLVSLSEGSMYVRTWYRIFPPMEVPWSVTGAEAERY